jgi:hypothetical protein
MQEATKRVLLAMVTVAAAGCSSMPEPRMLLPSGKISPQQIASLGRASGTVVDPQSALPVSKRSLTIPFN